MTKISTLIIQRIWDAQKSTQLKYFLQSIYSIDVAATCQYMLTTSYTSGKHAYIIEKKTVPDVELPSFND